MKEGVHFIKEKVVISGDIIEIISYSKLNTDSKDMTEVRNGEGVQRVENYATTQKKRRDKIRRLSTSNFDVEYAKFVTLTFRDNLKDVKKANKAFKQFIQRLRYKYYDFKYIAVIEFQKRGAVHYHMLSDLPFIPVDEVKKIWGNGFVKIQAIDHVDNIGAYLVKYMNKDNDDTRLQGEKGYLMSKNLAKPLELSSWKDGDALLFAVVDKYQLKEKTPSYASTYESDKAGTITYLQYNLNRVPQKSNNGSNL